MKSVLPPDTVAWAKRKCAEVIRTARVTAIDGTTLFTPDGTGTYGALWTRDFAYLVEHGSEFLDRDEVRAAIELLLIGQRPDGAMPDRVNRNLVPIYHPGPVDQPFGSGPALDNGTFMVSLLYHYHRHFDDPACIDAALPALRRGLQFIPRNRHLVFNDAQHPASTYGFQDSIGKGGHDLFCSLLWVKACQQMSALDVQQSAAWEESAQAAAGALDLLWDDSTGIYLAASEVCRQVDVWGNIFLAAHGIGRADRRERVVRYLEKNYAQFVYAGQVRHLPGTEEWERCLAPCPPETYQNGGYWGTPSAWFIEALSPVNPELAEQTFSDLLAFYQTHGVLEWSTPAGGRGPDLYVATILNLWPLIKQRS